MLPRILDQGAGQRDAFVGLLGDLGQGVHGLPIVAHRERLIAEYGLQFGQVLAPRLLALTVLCPALDRHLQLVSNEFEQGWGRQLIDAEAMLCTKTVSPSRTKPSIASSCGRCIFLPEDA